ncbi:MAG: hypothetical protein U0790_07445 [Isosphaeraceae bacterium]
MKRRGASLSRSVLKIACTIVAVLGAASARGQGIPAERMRRIYEEVKTPYKYGVVLRPEPEALLDCPSVFRHGNAWYMLCVCMNRVGYETRLARSTDLLHWENLGTVLPFAKQGWDAWQGAGYVALQDPTWGGRYELQTCDGKYWMSYIGGALKGYETDPLAIGLAWTLHPERPVPWTRLGGNPVMTRDQPDARPFEKATLYKSHIIRDEERRTGFPFVMYYNGKQAGVPIERIGMAGSEDMVRWKRIGAGPVIDNQKGISGDPQLARIGDTWVMFYFGAFWKPDAFDTFAASTDLVHWTKWDGPNLVQPSEPWDRQFAHKPWLIKHDGVVYHFYCAVGDQGRVIALATSRDLRRPGARGGE